MVPHWVTHDEGFRPLIWEKLHICEVNGTRKVKSDGQVTVNKKSDPVQKLSPGVAGEDSTPTQIFLRTSGIIRKESS